MGGERGRVLLDAKFVLFKNKRPGRGSRKEGSRAPSRSAALLRLPRSDGCRDSLVSLLHAVDVAI